MSLDPRSTLEGFDKSNWIGVEVIVGAIASPKNTTTKTIIATRNTPSNFLLTTNITITNQF